MCENCVPNNNICFGIFMSCEVTVHVTNAIALPQELQEQAQSNEARYSTTQVPSFFAEEQSLVQLLHMQTNEDGSAWTFLECGMHRSHPDFGQ